jgi:hypothetical protein
MTYSIRLSAIVPAVVVLAAGCNPSSGLDLSGDWCEGQPKAVGAIAVSPTSLTLISGGSSQVTASVTTPTGEKAGLCVPLAQWTSANPAVASVDGSGDQATVTAVSGGQTVITVSTGGKSTAVPVTVTNPAIVSLKLTVDSLALLAGHTARVGVVGRDARGVEYQLPTPLWTLSDVSHARVSANGTVTALDTGDVILKVTTRNIGVVVSAEIPVRITNAAPWVKVQQLAAGRSHTCALVGGGTIPLGTAYCWGSGNYSGALGNGSANSSITPTPVSGGLTLRVDDWRSRRSRRSPLCRHPSGQRNRSRTSQQPRASLAP